MGSEEAAFSLPCSKIKGAVQLLSGTLQQWWRALENKTENVGLEVTCLEAGGGSITGEEHREAVWK